MIKILVTIILHFFEIFKKIVWGLYRFYIFLLIFFTVQTSVQSFNQNPNQITIEKIRGGSKDSNSFVPPARIDRNKLRPNQQNLNKLDKVTPLRNPKPNLIIRLPSTGDDSGGSGDGSDQSDWTADSDYWTNYKYNYEDFAKNKDKNKNDKQKTCSTSDELQNKAGIDALPDSCNHKYSYDISTKKAKQSAQKLWGNKIYKKTTISMLESIDKDIWVRQENLEGFKTLKKYKKNDIRIIAVRGKGNKPEKVVAIIARDDLEDLLKVFKKKYN
jgi:hypothetical protein